MGLSSVGGNCCIEGVTGICAVGNRGVGEGPEGTPVG